MTHEPVRKTCFLCEHAFLAEWARLTRTGPWHMSELCPACEEVLRKRAA